MKLEVNVNKNTGFVLLGLVIILAGIFVACAAYPASGAGHNAGEVIFTDGKTLEQKMDNVCLSNGTGCNPLALSCVRKSVNLHTISYVYCDIGYVLVDCRATGSALSYDNGVACTSNSTVGTLIASCCKIIYSPNPFP